VNRWRVHKFGGSSLADAACMERVAGILEEDPSPRLAVVASACLGVTSGLLGLVAAAERESQKVSDGLRDLRDRHADTAKALLDAAAARTYLHEVETDCRSIRGILETVRLIRAAPPAVRDLVSGFGEIWSSRLLAQYLQRRGLRPGRVDWIDARDLIEVQWGVLGPSVRWSESTARINRIAPADPEVTWIIPGFVARDAQGLQTTLGRNGSDLSASIVGVLLGAAEITIWTDVDGVLSADPRLVPGAKVIASLSYHEAMELAYFGAKVIHPQTMTPAVTGNLPIRIRNTFAPERPGTLIDARPAPKDQVVKGVTSIDRVALINVEGAGMIGVPGTAQRLFSALREHGISVIMISQGSSEHSICFAVPLAEAIPAERVVREAFDAELRHGHIQSVDVTADCSILAIVGDGMAGTCGVAAKLFGALGGAGVNVRAIAQGASERNISVVIDAPETARALRAVHSSFYLSPHTVSIGLIGAGQVGSTLIDQLASQIERLAREFKLDLRVRGIMSSRRMLLGDPALNLDGWRNALAAAPPPDLLKFEAHVHADHVPHAVIIDCTASEEVAWNYPRWLAAGLHVVTPNKKASSANLAFCARLDEARRSAGSHYLYETTVGAGLPVIHTLRDLRETGDEITRIEGILSGTLSYLFNVWDGRESFAAIVRNARREGYAEPDPRDDLSGLDFARKLVILGREMGLRLEIDDVGIEALVPDGLAACGTEEFLERVVELDAPMRARLQAASARDRVLRYVGVLDAATQQASVGLKEFERSHPFANINLTDNVVRFITARYARTPLVVQGPGAGPAVTAGGVFADLLRVCAYLGARL